MFRKTLWSPRDGRPGAQPGLPEQRKALVERYMVDAEEAALRAQRAAEEQTRHEAADVETGRTEEEQVRRAAQEQARLAAEAQARRDAAREQARREAAEAQARRDAAQEHARREAAEAQARGDAAQEQARREAAEAQARRAAEEEARRLAVEEQARRKAARDQAQLAAEGQTQRVLIGMNPYVRAAVRMWWLVLIGLVAGGYVAMHIAKKHKPPTFAASAQVMVDSTQRPFLRTGITQTTQGQSGGTNVKTVPGTGATVTTTTPSQPGQSSQEQPNTQILVQAANLYPLLVTSEPVTALRTKLYGDIQGTVTAKALYANAGVVRFTPSQFPIIEIDTVAKSAQHAEKLANTTALALRHWVQKNQRQARVPVDQRIVLRPLETATSAVKQTHSRLGLALLVGAGVFAVFYALAVGLDLLIPSRRRKQQAVQTADKGDAPVVPHAEA